MLKSDLVSYHSEPTFGPVRLTIVELGLCYIVNDLDQKKVVPRQPNAVGILILKHNVDFVLEVMRNVLSLKTVAPYFPVRICGIPPFGSPYSLQHRISPTGDHSMIYVKDTLDCQPHLRS